MMTLPRLAACCTISGNSFVLDRWETVYPKGFLCQEKLGAARVFDEQGTCQKTL